MALKTAKISTVDYCVNKYFDACVYRQISATSFDKNQLIVQKLLINISTVQKKQAKIKHPNPTTYTVQ